MSIFYANPSSGSQDVSCGNTEGPTDGQTWRSRANAPKNQTHINYKNTLSMAYDIEINKEKYANALVSYSDFLLHALYNESVAVLLP